MCKADALPGAILMQHSPCLATMIKSKYPQFRTCIKLDATKFTDAIEEKPDDTKTDLDHLFGMLEDSSLYHFSCSNDGSEGLVD